MKRIIAASLIAVSLLFAACTTSVVVRPPRAAVWVPAHWERVNPYQKVWVAGRWRY